METFSYTKCRIPKSRSKFRSIYIVNEKWNSLLKKLVPELQNIFLRLDKNNINYGFVRRKNAVLNASQHIGQKYILSLDIEDFFDHVTPEHVTSILDDRIIDLCFIDGAPRQGLPTSPIIANIAFSICDKAIIDSFSKLGMDIVYTRYADDLTFSFNDKNNIPKVYSVAKRIIQHFGFKLNQKKTKLQSLDNGRVIITGVAVDLNGVHATRKIRKKMRAALHQKNLASYRGLLEWSKCKKPN